MSPFALIRQPFNWLNNISRYRATHSQAPNFAYDLCVRRISKEQKAQLDLSNWRAAGNAAEPISTKVLESFARTFAACGFRPEAFCPAYGLAEATLLVSSSAITKIPSIISLDPAALERGQVIETKEEQKIVRRIAGCGRLVGNTKVAIVNPHTLTKCMPDRIGEIWVADPSVARGYWQKKEESDLTFRAYLADTGEGPFLRTGDLGFIKDGELFVTGRIKDVIIIRGSNYYPQDLEWSVQQTHPCLRSQNGAAFAVEIEGQEKLVIVQELERGYLQDLDLDEVFELIIREVFEQYEIQVHAICLIKSGTLLKTSSGKIQRSASRQAFLEGSLDTVATWISPNSEFKTIENGERQMHDDMEFALQNSNSSQSLKTDELIRWLRDYATERVNSRSIDERRCIPPYILLDFGNRGLMGMQVSPEYGGLGLNNYNSMRLFEQLGAIDLALALVVFNHNVLGVRPILKYAPDRMRDRLLPILATGRELAAFALSEPAAGSNPRAIETQAIPDGEGFWQLRGTKVWSGLAAWAGVINVFAQTVDSQGELQGISGFAIRQGTPRMRQGAESPTMGMRGMVQNAIHLEGARVSRENLLGEVGQGMEAAQDAMMYGRLAIGAFSLGGMKRCAQLMLRYASRRSISTGRLLDNPVSLARLGELNAAIASLSATISRMSQLLDRGRSIPVEAYIVCKIAGAEFFWQATDSLIQLLGGRGYLETNIAPQLLRDARVCRIFEGPTETLNMFLGSRLINDSRELEQFLTQELKVPAIAQNLKIAAAEIEERCLSAASFTGDRTTARRWAAALVGEVATYGILLAFLEDAARNTASPYLQRASDWARLNLERKQEIAASGSLAESIWSNADIVTEFVSNYSETIGDLQQTLPGEDNLLDPLLQKQAGDSRGEVASPLQRIGVKEHSSFTLSKVTKQPTDRNSESIQKWLIDLLDREWNIPSRTIDPKKPFAYYGIDSVMAVNLSQELEDWLERPIEATIVWNFPTIESLASHLASELNSQDSSAKEQPETTKTQKDLDNISTEEIAQLLSQEIATVRHNKSS